MRARAYASARWVIAGLGRGTPGASRRIALPPTLQAGDLHTG